MTTVAVLGSTGSIGVQTIEVVAAEADRYEIVALAAGSSVRQLAEQANRIRPRAVGLADDSRAAELKELLDPAIEIVAGPDALADLAVEADVAVNGVVGFAGLPVTMAALGAGRRLALANKESLIAAGPVVRRVRDTPGAELVPVDSEHCAVHQCLRAGEGTRRLSRIVLTASGGPFRGRNAAELASVTVDQALAHPTWSMGPKITVDSSTLMNKGLEVIEAHELFDADYDDIEVVVHPQSVVHSMAEFTDGTTIAQLSMPDMRLPIGYALAYPDRILTPFGRMDWTEPRSLTFEPPDRATFRCLDLAYRAGRAGRTAPAWLSAANEVAVDAFLAGRIGWPAIASLVQAALDRWDGSDADSLDAVLAADAAGRSVAYELLASGGFDLGSPDPSTPGSKA
jgi:1-deoxy-D-xylulose-5-phosphate reductoisomerase